MTPRKTRQRAPSQRALATRARILDAAESVFARNGFDGATLRDIADLAGVRVSLVHHHGGGKDDLFAQTVARRAAELSAARVAALDAARQNAPLTPEAVLDAFFRPFMERAATDMKWRDYARLVAMVSADPRWGAITARHFDPTARIFLSELAALLPDRAPGAIASGFVYAVSAMLAQLTSRWRVDALGDAPQDTTDETDRLVSFCASGLRMAR